MSKVTYEQDAEKEWNDRTSTIKPSIVKDIPFSALFEKYLPPNQSFSCIEIGAIPGNFLVYFNKKFGYQVNGIDFAENGHLFHETMKKNQINKYAFINADFFKYNFTKQYDVVTSFGFVEHFDDVQDVLQKHCDLVKPGGYLIITLPNFRFLQHIYHYYFDKPNLDIHNLNAMHLGMLKRTLRKAGMNKLYANYFGNLSVWRQETELSHKQLIRVNNIHRFVAKHGSKLPTSRLYSPYIVLIYQKPNNTESEG